MTTAEKAKELVDEFMDKILMQHSAWNTMAENSFPMPLKFAKKAAIQCALMTVDEILNGLKQVLGNERHMWSEHQLSEILYLEHVKVEIGII